MGETLTAEIRAVEDADGLPGTFPDDYTFRWYRVDADGTSNRTPIAGAPSATCTLAAADARIAFLNPHPPADLCGGISRYDRRSARRFPPALRGRDRLAER